MDEYINKQNGKTSLLKSNSELSRIYKALRLSDF
jgi:hypothetical protein